MWGSCGPSMWTPEVRNFLKLKKSGKLPSDWIDFHILPPSMVYPIHWNDMKAITRAKALRRARAMIKHAFTLQLWRRAMEDMNLKYEEGSLFDVLLTELCGMEYEGVPPVSLYNSSTVSSRQM